MPETWKKSIIVPIYKKGDKKQTAVITFINYIQNLSNILLWRVTSYAEEIIGDRECGFWHNRSTTDHIFCIRQILQWNGNTVPLLFMDLKKAYDWVRREVFYYILIKFVITMKLVRLIKMCVNETFSRVWVGKQLSDMFCIKNGLRQGGTLLPLLVNFA